MCYEERNASVTRVEDETAQYFSAILRFLFLGQMITFAMRLGERTDGKDFSFPP